jgi:hypothetical protein
MAVLPKLSSAVVTHREKRTMRLQSKQMMTMLDRICLEQLAAGVASKITNMCLCICIIIYICFPATQISAVGMIARTTDCICIGNTDGP